ncbi:hypothetical protein A2533_04215 [Candidatus Falkowbacteria bacterium RIFOXYD2_FULL_35_9]|uniref:PEP-utilising enzyme mobile domain-containing protein n=1 Tax=Candidatus Falkowbacteria bacterium RIFOXYC2_FULL_36_12 TaxID=1798002 RepID=A0A1F5T302_9BACT|nr:MAG: hypothetical protein A2478_01430 [Candidatus Falkowbacteria bacterium RIFOXYC2_FULL_36_12]OGF33980.1 MAG: hypothetical protein A2223_01930 [Candidatus Falkowbacteria bacterium RIFOXYA2_FULL_35_8]OGF48520.1 MAG: hypothetical protein A2533_04215 [Candidatus Falkowbacteria bacterium RIFOXYD2_FULL_35_9]
MKNFKWIKVWLEEGLLLADLGNILRATGEKSQKRFGFGTNQSAMYQKKNYAEWYLPEEELARAENFGRVYFVKAKNIQLVEKAVEQAISNYFLLIKDMAHLDFEIMNHQELWLRFEKHFEIFDQFVVVYSFIDEYKYCVLENDLKEWLTTKNVADINESIDTVLLSEKKFIYNEASPLMSQSYTEVLKQTKNWKELLNEGQLFEKGKNDIREKVDLMNQLNPNEKIKKIIDSLTRIKFRRYQIRLTYMPGMIWFDYLLSLIYERVGLMPDDGRLYFYSELKNLLFGKAKKLSRDELKKRLTGCLKIYQQKKIKTYWGQEAEDKLKILTGQANEKSRDQLKGFAVSSGKVSGPVLVLSYKDAGNHNEKIKKMKGGEIIVTEMTRPNLLPALKKAAGVITDEGGITCHAAIVCREFKLPGLVGTKSATEIFKDGDLVELDTKNSIVRKIK